MDNLRLLVIDNDIHVLLRLTDLQRLEQTIRAEAKSGVSAESERQITMHDDHMNLAIRQRAYFIYEERGSTEGDPETDWLRAEHEILGSHPNLVQTAQHDAAPADAGHSKMEHGQTEHSSSDRGKADRGSAQSHESPSEMPSRRTSAA